MNGKVLFIFGLLFVACQAERYRFCDLVRDLFEDYEQVNLEVLEVDHNDGFFCYTHPRNATRDNERSMPTEYLDDIKKECLNEENCNEAAKILDFQEGYCDCNSDYGRCVCMGQF